jgi:hypothetical protein
MGVANALPVHLTVAQKLCLEIVRKLFLASIRKQR